MISQATSEIRWRKKDANYGGKTEWPTTSIAGGWTHLAANGSQARSTTKHDITQTNSHQSIAVEWAKM